MEERENRARRPLPMNGANLAMGHRLKRRREEIGLSQQQLALRIRKTQSCISLWENGVNGTNMDCFFELADVLRVDARWLATGKHG